VLPRVPRGDVFIYSHLQAKEYSNSLAYVNSYKSTPHAPDPAPPPALRQRRQPLPAEEFEKVRDELAELGGGITTYVRSPAKGTWKETTTRTVHDEIVIYEVMAGELDRQWWRDYRLLLEGRFPQQVPIVRARPSRPAVK